MKARKAILSGAAVLLVAGALCVPVFASANAPAEETKYPLCAVAACTRVADHLHNGEIYAAHTQDDGHSYHAAVRENETQATPLVKVSTQTPRPQQAPPKADPPQQAPAQAQATALCPLEGCTQTADHEHEGLFYMPHSTGDGHAYHNPAPQQSAVQAPVPAPAPQYQGICPYQNCTLGGQHAHDGGLYGQHQSEDGHAYHGQAGHESAGGGYYGGGGHMGGGGGHH